MRVAIRWGTAALTAGGLEAGLVMSLAPAGPAAASTVTASAGHAAALAELSDASTLVPAPSCLSATLCLAVASFAQGNTSRPVLTGELWNGTSGTAERTPEPPAAQGPKIARHGRRRASAGPARGRDWPRWLPTCCDANHDMSTKDK